LHLKCSDPSMLETVFKECLMFKDLFPSIPERDGYSLFEVNELIRRIGYVKGFEVIAEYPITVDGNLQKIDWVWREKVSGRVVHAFEIEGVNVPAQSLVSDVSKFETLRGQQSRPAIKCLVVTYTFRFSRENVWQELAPSNAAEERLRNLPAWISWVKDSELIDRF
jgi:hypothetical protein